jgi:hypothetical protein
MFGRHAFLAWSLAVGLVTAGVARASVDEDGPRRWNLHVDNDFFAFGNTDRDYTAGFNLMYFGSTRLVHTPGNRTARRFNSRRASNFARGFTWASGSFGKGF